MAIAIIAAVVIALAAVIYTFREAFTEVERIVRTENEKLRLDSWGVRFDNSNMGHYWGDKMLCLVAKMTKKEVIDPYKLCVNCKENTFDPTLSARLCRDCWPQGYTSQTEAA